MKTDEQAEHDDRKWTEGYRAAKIAMLRELLSGWGYDEKDPLQELGRLALMHQETLRALREICEEFGDNDWPDALYLPGVIEKHLARNLRECSNVP